MAANLNIVSNQLLTIKADFLKNFSVVFSEFDNIDTSYSLTLTKTTHPFNVVNFVFGNDITITTETLTLSFNGSDYSQGMYKGTLESQSKNSNVFLSIDIELSIVWAVTTI